MKYLLSVLCITLMLFSAHAQLGNYDENGEVKIIGQKAGMKITEKSATLNSDKQTAGAVMGAILGPIVDIGVAVAKEKAKQNAAKYLSSYTVTASGSAFWKDEKTVNLPVLTINRKIILKSTGKDADAMNIVLEPELSADHTTFRYAVKNPFTYLYSSAKTKGDFDYIDLKLDIKFKAVIITKSQYEVKDLRATGISLPMLKTSASSIPIDAAYVSGWIPLPAKPTLEVETDVTEGDSKTVTLKGTKDGKPVDETMTTGTISLKKKAKDIQVIKDDAGVYEFEVTVTETNPYKIKAENKQKIVEASGDASSALLKAIIEAATIKKDSKEADK